MRIGDPQIIDEADIGRARKRCEPHNVVAFTQHRVSHIDLRRALGLAVEDNLAHVCAVQFHAHPMVGNSHTLQ